MSIITISKDDEYETPWELYHQICTKYKVNPLLDVCATKDNKKCQFYYDKEHNGLDYFWSMTFWMNPPYSQVGKWVEYAYKQHSLFGITGVALIFSKTDTKWWHEYVEGKAEVHFIKGRVKFLKNGTKSSNSAPYPSCVVIWRRK